MLNQQLEHICDAPISGGLFIYLLLLLFFFASVQVCRANPVLCSAHAALYYYAHDALLLRTQRSVATPSGPCRGQTLSQQKGFVATKNPVPVTILYRDTETCHDSGFLVMLVFCRDNPSIQQ